METITLKPAVRHFIQDFSKPRCRYSIRCEKCGKYRLANNNLPCKVCEKEKTKQHLPCPFCLSLHTGTKGKTKYGIYYWRCRECGKSWVEENRPRDDDTFFGRKPITLESLGNCLRCHKPRQELANGLCLDCYDKVDTAQMQYYYRKKLLASGAKCKCFATQY